MHCLQEARIKNVCVVGAGKRRDCVRAQLVDHFKLSITVTTTAFFYCISQTFKFFISITRVPIDNQIPIQALQCP